MKKLIVKLLNLVYVAAAGVAAYAICTKPIAKVDLSVDLGSKKMAEILNEALGGSEESSETKALMREEKAKRDFITVEKIQQTFEGKDPVKLTVKIPAKKAFDIKNKEVLKEIITENCDDLINDTLDAVVPPIHVLIREATKEYAVGTIEDQIQGKLDEYFEGATVTQEQVDSIFDDVYNKLDGDESVTPGELTAVIMGDDDFEFREYDPQPTSENFKPNVRDYYLVDGTDAEGKPTYALVDSSAGFVATNTYYQKIYKSGVMAILQAQELSEDVQFAKEYHLDTAVVDASTFSDEKALHDDKLYTKNAEDKYEEASEFVEGNEYYYATSKEGIKYEDIDSAAVQDAMIQALEDIPELVNKEYKKDDLVVDAASFLSEKEAHKKLFTKSGESYTEATEYVESTEYYYEETTINDINSAMTALIQKMLGGESSESGEGGSEEPKEAMRSHRGDPVKEADPIRRELDKVLREKIPVDKIVEATDKLGDKAPLVLLALIAVALLPWAWFALVTLIRTLRKKKYWTKPRIIFFWAFFQLILGIGLTYGIKYALPLAAKKFGAIGDILGMIELNMATGLLIPSFIYLGMIPFTIVYKIFAHSAKVEYKVEKKLKKQEKKAAKAA